MFFARPSAFPEKSVNGQFDYDLVVIGGGSGGLAASQQATKINPKLKVACFDFVQPSPAGTTWGLGGTCVNVGCIPKKLMHHAGLLGASQEQAESLGWSGKRTHDWGSMVSSVTDMIRSLNYNYKKQLTEGKVEYINAFARFEDARTVSYELNGETHTITADNIIIATGGRPTMPNIPGVEHAISSDDIFWRAEKPGKTLLVGASYIALECAGFIHELGFDTSVMVRSILLRGFDRQCSEQIGEVMERSGVRFLCDSVPTRLDRTDPKGPIRVTWQQRGEEQSEEFDTVIMAIGRDADINRMGLDKTGVETEAGKVLVGADESTNVKNIFAIGDCIKDRPELTPVAIMAGQLLAKRIFAQSTKLLDYSYVPTTVFTPLEYGACGLSYEDAVQLKGEDNIEVYFRRYGALETACVYVEEPPKTRSSGFHGLHLWARQHAKRMNLQAATKDQVWEDFEPGSYEEQDRDKAYMKQPCLAKLVCDKTDNMRVLGFHYVGPNAGEITQGFALAVKLGATKDDFDNLVGIHPTVAEEFTMLDVTQATGQDFMKKGGC